MKIAMFSFADINNYGDILFSHIIEHELKKRIENITIDYFTPSSISIEGFDYQGYTKEKVDGKYDALILAGGEVVHFFEDRTWKPIYAKNQQKIESKKAIDIIWEWAAEANSNFKAWLSVGVRPFEDQVNKETLKKVLEELDYISVRGILSKKILEGDEYVYSDSRIKITPDLGWLFTKYIKEKNIFGRLYKEYTGEGDYMIVQIHNINEEESKHIGKSISKFAKENNLKVFLLPVIHLWNDIQYLELVEKYSEETAKILPSNLTVHEMADIITHSNFIICSSLHVAVTGLSNSIPSAIFNKWQGTKLQDLYGLQFKTEMVINNHESIEQTLDKLLKEKNNKSLNAYANFMETKLEEVFNDLANKVLKKS